MEFFVDLIVPFYSFCMSSNKLLRFQHNRDFKTFLNFKLRISYYGDEKNK